jgi:hypothetical protein
MSGVYRREMANRNAPKSSFPGLINDTMEQAGTGNATLGGLVKDTKSKGGKGTASPAVVASHLNPSATHISQYHYGQVLYPGAFMADAGPRLA